jgi:hypothetical protein
MSPRLSLKFAVAAATILAAFGGVAHAASQATLAQDKAAITAVISKYNEALNASNVNDCLALYAEDGVFMPPYSP